HLIAARRLVKPTAPASRRRRVGRDGTASSARKSRLSLLAPCRSQLLGSDRAQPVLKILLLTFHLGGQILNLVRQCLVLPRHLAQRLLEIAHPLRQRLCGEILIVFVLKSRGLFFVAFAKKS